MNAGKDRKDFKLLDYVRKTGPAYNDDYIAAKLYGKGDKAGFYRLKNRLLDYMGDYLVFHHTWKGDLNEMNRNISLFSIFKKRNQLKVALFYLKKAEQNAIAVEDFEMLDVIYSHYIKLSTDLLDINPELYIAKRRENAERLHMLREMDQALAALNYRLKITQNVAGPPPRFAEDIECHHTGIYEQCRLKKQPIVSNTYLPGHERNAVAAT